MVHPHPPASYFSGASSQDIFNLTPLISAETNL